MSEELKKHLTNAREKSIIMIHNQPNSSPLFSTDYLTASSYNSLYETVACGHNGDVYVFRNTYNTQGEIIGYYKEDGKTLPYYEGTRDFFIANEKYQKIFNDYEARHRAWTSTSAVRGLSMKNDNEMLFDDNETAKTLHSAFVQIFGDLNSEEVDTEFEKIFGKTNNDN